MGIVTDMKLKAEEGRHAQLILSGASTTILLDRGKRYQAFADTNLASVFSVSTNGLSSLQLNKWLLEEDKKNIREYEAK